VTVQWRQGLAGQSYPMTVSLEALWPLDSGGKECKVGSPASLAVTWLRVLGPAFVSTILLPMLSLVGLVLNL
jgi:hypothetical protein